MQISLKWINELVNLETIELEDLINKLTLGGFEVEEILEVEIENTKTISLDISATANRSDSLSIQGLSLEIAALLNHTPKTSTYSTKSYTWSEQIENVETNILAENACSSFISLTLENLSDFTSPKWLQQKLIASGIIIDNSLLDFQNYILLEMGYPLEFYDLDRISSKLNNSKFKLHLTSANNPPYFLAKNDVEYKLNNSILVIKADALPISIAGVISNKDTTYSNTTTSLLVEGSIFNAAKIRQESRILGLRTDRSSRYEKSLKDTNLLEALYRLIALLRISNPKLICKLHTVSKSSTNSIQIIDLDYKKIKQILGPIKGANNTDYIYISPQIITSILERLQFTVTYDSKNRIWNVIVPSLRSDDIVREIDLIEEIGRIYGFNKFLTRLPIIKTIGSEDFDYQTRKKLTTCFINLGLNELIQYSLVNSETYLKNDIELINPLAKDYSNLRSSLLPSLIKASEENLKKGNSVLEGFEYGHVFSNSSSTIVEEIEYIAGMFGGVKIKTNWSDSTNLLSWFEAKGKIDQFFKKLNILTYWKSYKPIKEKNIFHLYRTAEIFLSDGRIVGIFGQISPVLAKKLNISTNIYLFEFNFELIKTQFQLNKLAMYHEYSVYPKIVKDLSFIIKNTISFNEINNLLHLNGSQFLKEINLLDEYNGESIPIGHNSLCLQLVFQSDNETLQNKKIETIITSLKNVLIKKLNAIIRI
jgi:phenylalanyl-tRNA synthetase beta chain